METLVQFKCVCKSWGRSLFDLKFTKSLISRAPTCFFLRDWTRSAPYRCFVPPTKHVLAYLESLSSPNNMVLKFSDPNEIYNRASTGLPGIIGSCNGVLCSYRLNNKTDTVIFSISNPITSESIPLPSYKIMDLPDHHGFGFSPISDVYKVVLFHESNKCEKLEVMVLTVGSGIWRSIGKVSDAGYTINGVFHNGFIHWIWSHKRSDSLYIRAFDVETERFKDLPMPPCSLDWKETISEIGVLKGSLSITFRDRSDYTLSESVCIWVMKEHGVKKSWTKELEIGDIVDSNGKPITRDVTNLNSRRGTEVLTFLDEGKVLLLRDYKLCLYTPATRALVRVEVDGIPSSAGKALAGVHIPSFVSPKDIIRDYISKHPEEEAGTSGGQSVEVNIDIKMPAWTTSVAGWGENDERELLEIPRGQPTPCLPLPEDLNTATTASTLLDMINGLNALLLHKCMVGKDEIKRLRKENEELRASARLLSERPDDGEGDFVSHGIVDNEFRGLGIKTTEDQIK